eukprot:Lithocolla_globosa_v1_NODE_3345_length_1694_cov_7.418548.p2 type:complete len:107 gc:universal NODE_3345_length_1694_cov_7.418548:653-333(-)
MDFEKKTGGKVTCCSPERTKRRVKIETKIWGVTLLQSKGKVSEWNFTKSLFLLFHIFHVSVAANEREREKNKLKVTLSVAANEREREERKEKERELNVNFLFFTIA